MSSELRELAVVVQYTVAGAGRCKRIHVGRGLSEDQCDELVTWIRRYPELAPDAQAIVLLPNVMDPDHPITFTPQVLEGLDRVCGLFVSNAWWTMSRDERERGFVQDLLMHSLVDSGIVAKGTDGRPVLLEDGGAHRGYEIARRLAARVDRILRRDR